MAQCSFVNEVGNSITIEVVKGDQELCRFAIIGPNSTIESYVTLMELTRLRDVIETELKIAGCSGSRRAFEA